MESKAEYKQAMRMVRSVIATWDPYSLLAGGAPSDEFDHEVAILVTRIGHIDSASSAAKLFAEVFSAQFDSTFDAGACAAPGERLFQELREAGLLTPRLDDR